MQRLREQPAVPAADGTERTTAPMLEEGAAFSDMMELAGSRPRRAAGRYEVIVIGAGQSGLSVGYHLARLGVNFMILDAHARVGDTWRQRWDSLRLFTPAQFDSLDGLPFPAPAGTFPTKDEMADYLQAYATRFQLPVRSGVRVDRVGYEDGRYLVHAGDDCYEAGHVVVAMAHYQKPVTPVFAQELSPRIVQLHSFDYRRPSQLPEGDVLIVGGGNSGSEVGADLARAGRHVWFSGRDVGQIPFDVTSRLGSTIGVALVVGGLFHHLLTVDTPLGRRMRAERPSKGGPLIRTKWRHLKALGAKRVPRLAGTRDGLPLLADGRTLDVAGVVWCTGFHPGYSWIDRPVFEPDGEPRHRRGIVPGEPGLYFIGLRYQYAMTSTMVHGVGRDARHVAGVIAERVRKGAARVA